MWEFLCYPNEEEDTIKSISNEIEICEYFDDQDE